MIGPQAPDEKSTVTTLLAEGRLDEALAIAAQSCADRSAMAAALMEWADTHATGTDEAAIAVIRVYLASLELEPGNAMAYERLAVLAAAFPETGEHVMSLVARGTTIWQSASVNDGRLLQVPVFVRAGRLLSDLGEPERPDGLALSAASGHLSRIPFDAVLDYALPESLRGIQVRGAAGGLVAVTARQPDGAHVGLVILTQDAAVKWWLEGCTDLSLSPQGRWAAWVKGTGPGARHEILVLDTESGRSRVLSVEELLGFYAAWSPDEQSLAFSSRDGLILVDTDGRNRRILAEPESWSGTPHVDAFPQWLGAGGNLATRMIPTAVTDLYSAADALRVIDLNSCTKSRIEIRPLRWFLDRALWSPDGRYIACSLCYEHAGWIQLVAPQLGLAGDHLVTFGPVEAWPVSWSPDSSSLLFSMGPKDDPDGVRLWIWSLSTGSMSLLSTRPYASSIWGDDGVIYWATPEPGTGQWRLMGIRPRTQ
ncbi:MAG: hypothetical protein Q8P50_06695 [Bacillota bacterium]|nr:hypothetical protein [Bacillota bacterium]